jgi:opacity protein-like surface antigen
MMTLIGRFSWMGGVVIALCAIGSLPAIGAPAEETVPPPAVPSDDAPTAKEQKKDELYIGLFMLGTIPSNRPLTVESDTYSNTNVEGGLGGGIKVGLYPAFARRIVGIEGELSGFNGNVDAPQTTSGGVTRSANFRLNVFNAMANLLFRYPGDIIQPYVGAGIGLSGGFARDINIQNSAVGTINENAGDAAFAYQLIGGARVNVTNRLFVFSEYKYMVANYKWESELSNGAAGPSFSLPFRTHIISGGVGFNF